MARGRASLTILVAARNAASTIGRAVASCLPESCPIVLADDRSTDGTAGIARAAAGGRLRVVGVGEPGGVARARQRALDAVETPYAAWLDADDEWRPGRAARLARLLEAGSDVAVEAIDLHDGPTGSWLRRLTVPAYLRAPGGGVRLFERNQLPGDTQVMFRTDVFREAGGYDPAVEGPESYDLLLRALRQGARLACGDAVGYRMFAYPGSLSRDLLRQRAALAAVLAKHEYEDVRRLYLAAGHPPRLAAWALVLMAQFRGDTATALRWLDAASPEDADPREILEPDGPWPFPEGWRRTFHRGTILLAQGGADGEAAGELRRAEAIQATAEGANNLGVAEAGIGRMARARALFAEAATRFPGYVDAARNLADARPRAITTHPLRRAASRSEYALTPA